MNKMCVKTGIKFLCILLGFLSCFIFADNLFAAVMSSTNYQIQSDDISAAGGNASSVNYIFRDTLGEVSTGLSSGSASYKLRAGWQEMLESVITISAPASAVMKPDIPGMTGGTAATSTSWYVITDNGAGFNLKINSSTNPAMQLSGDPTHYFDNYPASPTYTWGVTSGDAQFGFTVEPGTTGDLLGIFLDNGSSCGLGSYHADTCWVGFNGTGNTSLINRTSRTNNNPGENEVIKFQAQSNAAFLNSGTYQGTVTVTASTN
jgi:hypothetical protein